MRLGYSPSTAGLYSLEANFKLADELGLEFVELGCEVQEVFPRLQPLKRIKELSRATGVGVTVHLPFVDLNLASLIPVARQTAVERTLRGLDYAAGASAGCAVLHSGQNPFYPPAAQGYAFDALYQSLLELHPPPVPIALENIALDSTWLVREPQGLQEITRRFGLHNCLDFGHAFLERNQPWRLPEQCSEDLIGAYISTLGEAIIHLHLHGNDGSADQHRPTDEGAIPYQRYASYLRDFPGTTCLEVSGGTDGVRRSVIHLRTLVDGIV